MLRVQRHRRLASPTISALLTLLAALTMGKRGCAVGYLCRYSPVTDCLAGESVTDPFVQILPRYHLCHSSQIEYVQGFPIHGDDAGLAYYSSHGDVMTNRSSPNSKVSMAVVVIHGSGRNADDYFCSMMAAARRQTHVDANSILVVAPRFPVAYDVDLDLVSDGDALRWSDSDSNGPWRYGASAIAPPSVQNHSLSSFEVMDRLVATLLDPMRYPHLQNVVVVGHSSGGQFVQRWSLLTLTWDVDRMRAVVANPSSYVYLTSWRYINHTWQYPKETNCSDYNQWEWGIDLANQLDTIPYVRSIVRQLGVERLKNRFASRRVVYLVGSLDICNSTSTDKAWCNSHGLETTCRDMLQGSNRTDRFLLYLAMLKLLGLPDFGRIVPGVGHDHSLMFHSDVGLSSIFGTLGEDSFGKPARWSESLDH